MDHLQLAAFIDYAVGFRVVGNAENEAVEVPHSPELRSFILARLGENTPRYGAWIVGRRAVDVTAGKSAKAFATMLREVADGIDPPQGIV